MKQGVILINAYTNGESELNQPKRLKEEFEARGVRIEVKRNFFTAGVRENEAAGFLSADFCVYLDKDKYAGELLEKAGLRLFNSPRAVAVCDDKMTTCIALAGSGIPVPETYAAPLCYSESAPANAEFLRAVGERLGYPLVVKESYGSLGKGVYKADDFESLCEVEKKLQMKPHLFQKFVSSSAGRDLRVIVIGGVVFAAMRRTSAGDFRSNLELGGRGEPLSPDARAAALCESVARRLGLDYCGVDLLFAEDGYTVCEVNSNAFFGGMERITGKNVAGAYAEYIIREVYGV